ncbi:MAG TPA: DUF4363 family protein [Bacillales bacterium]
MKRIVGGLIIALLIIGGWSSQAEAAKGGKAFYQQINKISELIDQGEWQKADKEMTALRKLYEKKLWKLQLIGDESEYEGLDDELEQLRGAIESRDKAEAKIQLSAVRTLVKHIYSL